MATFLDVGLIQKMNFLFPFLLVLIMSYVVLSKVKMFEDKKGFAALISFVLAMISLTSDIAIKTINMMSPWIILVVVFGVMLLLIFQVMGIKEDKIADTLTSEEHGPAFTWWIIALVLMITLGSLAVVISEESGFQDLTGSEASDEEAAFWTSLFHPKILGLVLVFLVAYFTISKLTSNK